MAPLRPDRAHSGFTLIEILIVVTILGILAAIATVQLASASNDAASTSFVVDLRTLANAATLHNAQSPNPVPDAAPGTMPASLQAFLPAANRFEAVTRIGGQWDVARDLTHASSAVGVVFTGLGPTRDDAFMTDVDRIIDDGDLNAGIFRKNTANGYYLAVQR